MDDQADLFDLRVGEALKAEGMAAAAENKKALLDYARKVGEGIALSRADRECTADCIQEALAAEGISVHALGNAAGSLFKGKKWEYTGRQVKSRRTHAHANLLKVWRYVGELAEA